MASDPKKKDKAKTNAVGSPANDAPGDPPAAGPAPKDSTDQAGSVRFLMLLRLTTQGRNQGQAAGVMLQSIYDSLNKVGEAREVMMTYGEYDAVVSGTCNTPEALAAFAALVNDGGYYSTETLIGFEPEWFVPGKHSV